MTVNFVYISFLAIVFILFMVSLYFIGSLIYKRTSREQIERKKKLIFNTFENLLQESGKDSKESMEILKKNFSSGINIKSFYLAYKKYVNIYGYSNDLRQILNQVVDYEKIINSRVVRSSYRKSYALYLISEFKLNDDKMGKIALDSLDDESLYVRNNSMRLISRMGNQEFMLETISRVSNSDKYFNSRIAIDFLDNYTGDGDRLNSEIFKRIHNYSERFKSLFIEHLINVNNDNQDIRDQVLDILANSKNNEILIKATRYFYSIIDERAVEYILKNMSNERWSLRASSSTAIQKYPGKETTAALKQNLKDPNYYVRKNAAASFTKIHSKEELFHEAYYNEDIFAKDALSYAIDYMGVEGFKNYKRERAEIVWE